MSGNLEQVTIVRPDGSGSPEGHDAAMIAKVDGASPAPRPEWLPEKFASVEDLAKSYKELEAKQGGPAAPAPAPVAAPAAAPVAAPAPAAQSLEITPEAVVAGAGLDMAALNQEYATTGALSTESMAKLATAGFDKAAVDTYIAGRSALQSAFLADVKSVTPGGAEKFDEMLSWAKANLTPAEITAYNKATSTSDANVAKLAVAGLGARFAAAVGNEPTLSGGRGDASGADVFESIEQMRQAMRDPRYKADPAYRSKVVAKLGRSNIM